MFIREAVLCFDKGLIKTDGRRGLFIVVVPKPSMKEQTCFDQGIMCLAGHGKRFPLRFALLDLLFSERFLLRKTCYNSVTASSLS